MKEQTYQGCDLKKLGIEPILNPSSNLAQIINASIGHILYNAKRRNKSTYNISHESDRNNEANLFAFKKSNFSFLLER